MFTRTATVLSALALTLSVGAAATAESKAFDIVNRPAATSQADLTNDQVKTMLETLGYEVTTTQSTGGGTFNRISFKRNGWTLNFGVNVSENGQYVWTIANLQTAEGVRQFTNEQLLALLSENWHIHPFRFQVSTAGLYLGGAVEAKSLTNVALRKLIDETADKVQSTQALWDVKLPTATADAAKK